MPAHVIDAAQRAQSERARVTGYLRGTWRALVVLGPLTSATERVLRLAGFCRVATQTWVWRTN